MHRGPAIDDICALRTYEDQMFVGVAPQKNELVARTDHQRLDDGKTPLHRALHETGKPVPPCGKRRESDKREHQKERARIAREIDDIHARYR